MPRFPVLVLWLASAALCAAQGPRILIVTDMEGVGGVNNADEQLLPGQRRYDESRRLLAGETNAAVDGAVRAGASEIAVWDGHDGSRSLSIDDIHPPARLIQGRPTPANYYMSERLYDGIIFVGQHAMAGAKNSVLAHTQNFNVQSITLNGRAVGEMGQVAAIAGYFKIPVIMLAGDQAACDEMKEFDAKAEVVAVKRLAGKASTLSLTHSVAQEQIQKAAQKAVERVREFSPWEITGPVEMVVRSYPDRMYPTGRVQTFRGRTVLEAYQAWLGE